MLLFRLPSPSFSAPYDSPSTASRKPVPSWIPAIARGILPSWNHPGRRRSPRAGTNDPRRTGRSAAAREERQEVRVPAARRSSCDREGDHGRHTATHRWFEPHPTTLSLDERSSERQSEARATRLPRARRISAEEPFERAMVQVSGHPLSVVHDRHERVVTVPPPMKIGSAASVTADVLEHRVEGRFQTDAICRNRNSIVAIGRDRCRRCDHAPASRRPARHPEIHGRPLEFEPAAVRSGQFQQTLRDAAEVVDLMEHVGREGLIALGQGLDAGTDEGQRCPELVRCVHSEPCLRFVGALDRLHSAARPPPARDEARDQDQHSAPDEQRAERSINASSG